jgi:hypothetical protein
VRLSVRAATHQRGGTRILPRLSSGIGNRWGLRPGVPRCQGAFSCVAFAFTAPCPSGRASGRGWGCSIGPDGGRIQFRAFDGKGNVDSEPIITANYAGDCS